MTFTLHSNLAKKTFIMDLPLSRVLFEDNAHYPWIFLVPRRETNGRLMDLNAEDQTQLMKEMNIAQKVMWELFKPTQLNVAAIGNKTPQLHVHVIARFETDPAWPGTVWDAPHKATYEPAVKDQTIQNIKAAFERCMK